MTDRWRRSLRELDTQEPSPNLWERAVSRSAEAPLPDLPAKRQRRIVAGTVAAGVAVAGVAVAFLALRGLGTAPEPGGLVTYRDPGGAWEIQYLERFRAGSIPRRYSNSRVTVDGVWIANVDPREFADGLGGPLWFDVPDHGVAVFFSQTRGGLLRLPREERDSSFPISFEDLRVVPGGPSTGTLRLANVVANGETYTLHVRMGAGANEEDRRAVNEIVTSLRFLPLKEGTAIGKQLTYFVLAPPDEFPVGSVSRFDDSNLPLSDWGDPFPFYLVHVPRGFYALAWPADLVGGYKDCDVTYEPASREFTCPNGARWALDGSVITKPDPDMPDDPLQVLLVRISLDGHVLVSPNVFMSETELDLKLT